MTDTTEFESLERELEAAFAVDVPEMHFQPSSAARPALAGPRRRWFVGGAAAAVAVLGAIILLPGLHGGGATAVNAEELVNKSSSATASLASSAKSYHLKAIIQGKSPDAMTTETWSFGEAGNRYESTFSQKGDVESQGQVATPNDYWIWASVGGQLKVAHVSAQTARVNDFAALADSLDGVLQGLVVKNCQEAVIDGSAQVAGRDATVVHVRPTPETCKAEAGRPETEKLSQVVFEMGSSTLWIDKETNVQLRVENYAPDGTLTTRYEVQLFETGSKADASVLHYSPPAGTQVIEAADYSEAKHAIYSDPKK